MSHGYSLPDANPDIQGYREVIIVIVVVIIIVIIFLSLLLFH